MRHATPAVPEPSTESDIALRELVETLRSRADNGAPFWNAIREQVADVPDDGPAPRWQARAGSSVVYYIRFGDRVKIGTSTNLAARLTAIPHDELLATEPGDRNVEKARHAQFAASRVIGEWFTYTDELRQHIADLI